MTGIPGVNIPDTIVPFDTNDSTATHDEKYGKGGWRSVANLTERDAIPSTRRVEGMIVNVLNDVAYKLTGGITNSNWEIYNNAQGSLNSLSDVIITNLQPGQTLLTDGINWYNGEPGQPISGSSATYQGSFSLDTVSQLYTIYHSLLPSISAGNPVISLQLPTANDYLFALGVLNRTTTSFDIVLSQIPSVSGYAINWNLGIEGNTIAGSTLSISTIETASFNISSRVSKCDSTLDVAYTATLPSAIGLSGITYYIKKVDVSANKVRVLSSLSQTIDDALYYDIMSTNDVLEVVSDGSNWIILNK